MGDGNAILEWIKVDRVDEAQMRLKHDKTIQKRLNI